MVALFHVRARAAASRYAIHIATGFRHGQHGLPLTRHRSAFGDSDRSEPSERGGKREGKRSFPRTSNRKVDFSVGPRQLSRSFEIARTEYSFSRSVDRDVSREKGRMQAEAMILQVSSRETERSTSTVAVKNDKQGERERGREKKGNRDGKVSKEAENLCNNRETSDSPSRKKTGKGSKGRGEREERRCGIPTATSYYRRLAWRRDDNRGKK